MHFTYLQTSGCLQKWMPGRENDQKRSRNGNWKVKYLLVGHIKTQIFCTEIPGLGQGIWLSQDPGQAKSQHLGLAWSTLFGLGSAQLLASGQSQHITTLYGMASAFLVFATAHHSSSPTFLPYCYIYPMSISCPILLYMDIMSLCMYVVYM